MSATGILSKDITLSYKKGDEFIVLHDMQEIPQIGGAAERVDVTTLEDGNYRYISGIKDFGELAFTFLYDNSAETSSYRILRGLEDAGTVTEFELALPDGTKIAFSGQVSTEINSAGVNAALQFTANITLNSDMAVTNPTA